MTIEVGGGPVSGTVGFGAFVDGQDDTEPDVEIHGDDIWEMLFTSGTTAMPKGVMISHSASHVAAMSFALSLTRGTGLENDVRVGTFLPMIYHVGELIFALGAFVSGGTLVVGRRPVPADVALMVAEERVTALWAGSPQFVTALTKEFDAQGLDVTCLDVLVYGWGALPPPTYARLLEQTGEIVVLGIFGQTEAITCHRFWPRRWPETYQATAPVVNYVGLPSPLLASDVFDEDGVSLRDQPGRPGRGRVPDPDGHGRLLQGRGRHPPRVPHRLVPLRRQRRLRRGRPARRRRPHQGHRQDRRRERVQPAGRGRALRAPRRRAGRRHRAAARPVGRGGDGRRRAGARCRAPPPPS